VTEQRSLVEQAADVAFYAPVGFALEVRRLVPELAERGRRQVTFNWMVGRYAVRRARARADEVVDLVSETAGGLLDLAGVNLSGPAGDAAAEGDPGGVVAEDGPAVRLVPDPDPAAEETVDEPAEPSPDPEELAIPGYDSLSAFQVVPRLEGLGGDELEAVRQYEHATRGRRTILSRIAQLQASA
jgi:hypothetical protein